MPFRPPRLPGAIVAVALVASSTLLGVPQAAAAPTLTTVRLSASSVVAGTPVTASIAKARRPAGTTLVLQRRYPDAWRTADGSATARGTRLELTVPTSQFGSFVVRVAALKGGRAVAVSPWQRIRVRPPYTPVGKPAERTFQTDRAVGRIIRWDSCRPIRWRFNPANAPANGLTQVTEGVRRVRAATGLDFRYAGTTKLKPNPYGTGLTGAEVVIGWRTGADYAPFRGSTTVGQGGNSYYSNYREPDGAWVNRAVLGGVVLNKDMNDRLSPGFGPGLTWGEVIIHELGHVVGLDHTAAQQQIMHRQVIDRNADWGAGDLAGLARVGDTRGCLRPVSARAQPLLARHAAH